MLGAEKIEPVATVGAEPNKETPEDEPALVAPNSEELLDCVPKLVLPPNAEPLLWAEPNSELPPLLLLWADPKSELPLLLLLLWALPKSEDPLLWVLPKREVELLWDVPNIGAGAVDATAGVAVPKPKESGAEGAAEVIPKPLPAGAELNEKPVAAGAALDPAALLPVNIAAASCFPLSLPALAAAACSSKPGRAISQTPHSKMSSPHCSRHPGQRQPPALACAAAMAAKPPPPPPLLPKPPLLSHEPA